MRLLQTYGLSYPSAKHACPMILCAAMAWLPNMATGVQGGEINILSLNTRVESDTFAGDGDSLRQTEEDSTMELGKTVSSMSFIPVSNLAVSASISAESTASPGAFTVRGTAQTRLSPGLTDVVGLQFASGEADVDLRFSLDADSPFMLSGFVNRDFRNSKVKTFATASLRSTDGGAELGFVDLMTRSMRSDSGMLPAGNYRLSVHLDSRTELPGGAESLAYELAFVLVPEPVFAPTAVAVWFCAGIGLVLRRRPLR